MFKPFARVGKWSSARLPVQPVKAYKPKPRRCQFWGLPTSTTPGNGEFPSQTQNCITDDTPESFPDKLVRGRPQLPFKVAFETSCFCPPPPPKPHPKSFLAYSKICRCESFSVPTRLRAPASVPLPPTPRPKSTWDQWPQRGPDLRVERELGPRRSGVSGLGAAGGGWQPP